MSWLSKLAFWKDEVPSHKKGEPWLPDWNLHRFSTHIVSDHEDFESLHDVEVVKEGKDLYRLYDIPYCDGLCWGDLIKVKEDRFLSLSGEPLSLELIEIVERSEHSFTGPGFLNGKRHAGLILDAIMEAGGFWADDALMGFDVIIPPGFDVGKWEEENKDLIEGNSRKDTHYDKWMKFMAGERHEMRERSKLRKRELS